MAHLHQTMRSEPDVRQETSPSNNEKCNIILCRQGTPSSNTERRGTGVGHGTSPSNTEKWNLCRTGHIFNKHREVELM